MWMTSCTGSARGGFGGFWWKSVELILAVRRRRVTFASSQRPCGGCHTCWGWADGKVIIETLCISLPYVETFNSRGIKGFVPELRSRKCFSYFGIPMFYVYMLWTFYVRFTYSRMAMLHPQAMEIIQLLKVQKELKHSKYHHVEKERQKCFRCHKETKVGPSCTM